jgi:hypothetical protein
LKSALDAGAGVGLFSQTLLDYGPCVRGFDRRPENVAEARKRFPRIAFEQGDLQDPSILNLGRFDFVLRFGFLYRLENPLLAVRDLRSLMEKCLLLESMCVPDDKPSMLLREEPRACDQGLTDVAYYPSEGSLIKMLYRLYDALNTGSSRSTGTIMRWLNASDVLHTSGLFVVGSVFTSLPLVDWLTGRPTRLSPNDMTVDIR